MEKLFVGFHINARCSARALSKQDVAADRHAGRGCRLT